MGDNSGDELIGRLVGVAAGDSEPGEKAALVERLFALLPPERQERLLRDLLGGSEASEEGSTAPTGTDEPTPRASDEQPSTRRKQRRVGPPFMRSAPEGLPFRDIGPWQMCCRMMANVDQAPTVDDVDAELPAEVFAALGDETRIKIIRFLQDDERRFEDIAQALDIPRSTLSHHLRVLREAGLIQVDRRGRGSFYSLPQPEETP